MPHGGGKNKARERQNRGGGFRGPPRRGQGFEGTFFLFVGGKGRGGAGGGGGIFFRAGPQSFGRGGAAGGGTQKQKGGLVSSGGAEKKQQPNQPGPPWKESFRPTCSVPGGVIKKKKKF